jgi:DNA-binding GntR family transcriptional regulator
MSDFKARPPVGIDPTGVSEEGSVAYELIRDDIISGRLEANARLVVAELSERHGAPANAVREALQLLRSQGFVLIVHNKSARVRPIDRDFVRDVYEIGVLIEPSMVRWFVDMATPGDIAELEEIQRQIEENNFDDPILHSELDTQFHTLMYDRHYNHLAAELWWKHRELLRALARRYSYTLSRRAQVIRDHRELLRMVKAGDAENAALLIAAHVDGAGRHVLEQMRAATSARAG